jgi:hypothetical protein
MTPIPAATTLQLNYYVLGDNTDFCYPLSIRPEESILRLIKKIQEQYLEYMGVKLVFIRLFNINQPQGEMAGISAPTTRCLGFATRVQDYWTVDIDPDLVHILVIAGREWRFISRVIHPFVARVRPHLSS